MCLELDLAVEMEYKVVKIHEVWHFQDKTNRLFRGKETRSFQVARVVDK